MTPQNKISSSTPKTLSILGATGSIGLSTLDLVRRNSSKFNIKALTANARVQELAALAKEFQPEFVAIADESKFNELRDALSDTSIEIGAGESALVDAANIQSDIVMAAIVGAAGLRPTMAAVKRGVTVALANKECLVCAGDLLTEEVKKSGATLLPVDSEHNAIFQVFDFEKPEHISRVILTASGGPFRDRDGSTFSTITPAEAVAHPNWDMGAKISVDSATLMNKGLELIEAYHLFPLEQNQLSAIIHPQSVVHSMVEYSDGSVLAQMGSPDMRTPIGYALAWPDRMETPVKKLSLADIGRLDFVEPDLQKFPCLQLAIDAMQEGGAAPIILNAANEIAVEAFLQNRIKFTEISTIVCDSLSKCDMKAPQSIANVFAIDKEVRTIAKNLVLTRSN